MSMKHAMEDWKARQAGEREEPKAPEREAEKMPPQAIVVGYPGRPHFCTGGMRFDGRAEDGRLLISKPKRCDELPDWRTGLCEDCQRRESHAREEIREAMQPKEEPRSAGRGRFQ